MKTSAHNDYSRREFLKLSGMALAGAPLYMQTVLAGEKSPVKSGRVLVLIELKGGNDGLNTVVPFSERNYYKLRPTLAIPENQLIKLDDATALAPACKSLRELWDKGDLAIVRGVGYPNPNHSHFRSIDIWETASGSEQFLATGWCSRVLQQLKPKYPLPVQAIIMGNDDVGPVRGGGISSLIMNQPDNFIRQAARVSSVSSDSKNSALKHIVEVQNNIVKAAEIIQAGLKKSENLSVEFPNSVLGRQLKSVAEMMAAGLSVPLFKVGIGGFDTHNNQMGNHQRLMKDLSEAIVAFRNALIVNKIWNNVMIMSYSEFGRRVKENGSRGTDHGTAAPHFVIGGKVKGGFYGKQPSLRKLDNNGDLIYSVDYRSVYTTVAEKWWRLNNHFLKGKFKPLDFV